MAFEKHIGGLPRCEVTQWHQPGTINEFDVLPSVGSMVKVMVISCAAPRARVRRSQSDKIILSYLIPDQFLGHTSDSVAQLAHDDAAIA